MSGLGIRCLNKHLLSVVLGYLNLRGGASAVCVYWHQIMAEARIHGCISGPQESYHVRPQKPRFVKIHRSSDVRAEALQATLSKYKTEEKVRWMKMGIETRPMDDDGENVHRGDEHAQWRLMYSRKVTVQPSRSLYRDRFINRLEADETVRDAIDPYDEGAVSMGTGTNGMPYRGTGTHPHYLLVHLYLLSPHCCLGQIYPQFPSSPSLSSSSTPSQ